MPFTTWAKSALYSVGTSTGVSRLVERTHWRDSRLLILGYHGISLEDEHVWNPELYCTAERFERRMRFLRERRYTVLPFQDALSRINKRTLPPRSVVITFDDGFYDFAARAFPVLKRYGFPVTVYQTTYYSVFQRPVFDVMCSYLLWKGRSSAAFDIHELIAAEPFDLRSAGGRLGAINALKQFARSRMLSAKAKDDLLVELASRLGLDYEEICRKRILQLLSPSEIAGLSAEGVDFQLHTHRHRLPYSRPLLLREIDDNRQVLQRATSKSSSQLCYPNGFYHAEIAKCAGRWGITSAVTAEVGLVEKRTDSLRLPRVIDTVALTDSGFEAWASGFAQWLPRRKVFTTNGHSSPEVLPTAELSASHK